MVWRFFERVGAQAVSFIVQIVLARIIMPEAYGTIALLTVFTAILNVFVDSGLGNALVQKKDADNIDFSTVFFTNIFFCLTLYLLLFFASPLIAIFYKRQELVPLVRVLGLTIVVSGVKNVQQAYVSKNLLFKKFFVSTLAGTIIAAVVGIYMAMNGYGVWALVAQQVVNVSIDTTILWFTVRWRPTFVFSFERLGKLFSYGWKLLVSALLETVYNNLRQLIIGRSYSAQDLAYFNRGKTFPNVIITNINSSISSVMLPVMSKEQDNLIHLKEMMRKCIVTSCYIMAPMMIGMAVMTPNIVSLLLTDAWLPCVPYMRIFCIIYIFYPIHTSNLTVISALGRSDLFLKLEIAKKIVGFTMLLISMHFGVMAMAYSLLVECFLGIIINTHPNKRLLNYSYLEQLKDIIPCLLVGCFMGGIVYFVGMIQVVLALKIFLQIIAGIFIYLLVSIFFKIEAFKYLLSIFNIQKLPFIKR